MMPILVEITYEDGTLKTSSIQLKSEKKIMTLLEKYILRKQLKFNPKLETADIDVTNNTWPKEIVKVNLIRNIKKERLESFL
jgi:predicted DNA-binding antitoxin AbrB/MazE fold protein